VVFGGIRRKALRRAEKGLRQTLSLFYDFYLTICKGVEVRRIGLLIKSMLLVSVNNLFPSPPSLIKGRGDAGQGGRQNPEAISEIRLPRLRLAMTKVFKRDVSPPLKNYFLFPLSGEEDKGDRVTSKLHALEVV